MVLWPRKYCASTQMWRIKRTSRIQVRGVEMELRSRILLAGVGVGKEIARFDSSSGSVLM